MIRLAAYILLGVAMSATPTAFARDGGLRSHRAPPAPILLMQSAGSQCPANATALRGTGASVTCFCPASATQGGSVWGTDIYTDDSAICAAARHAGVIDARGGTVSFTLQAGLAGYKGSARNGIASSNYGPWEGSFVFAAANSAVAVAAPPTLASCPITASQLRGQRRGIRCQCSAAATATQGSVWGSDIYTDDSNICRAALHAGLITRNGGPVTVTPLPGRAGYPGTTRNGVATSEYGSWPGSFTFGK